MAKTALHRKIVQTACIFLLVGIALAAVGSHALEGKVPPKVAEAFTTGVTFVLLHGIAFLALGNSSLWQEKALKNTFRLLVAGVLCFSGSIFLLTLFKLFTQKIPFLPLITPLGGLLLILGWGYAALSLSKK